MGTINASASCVTTAQSIATAQTAPVTLNETVTATTDGQTVTSTPVIVQDTCGGDDVSYQVALPTTINFAGSDYNAVYATTNSTIVFGRQDNAYANYPATTSISVNAYDWVVLDPANSSSNNYPVGWRAADEHLIITSSQAGFQVDLAVRPYGANANAVPLSTIVVTAAINANSTLTITYLSDVQQNLQTRTGVRLPDGRVVTLEEAGLTRVYIAPVVTAEEVQPAPTPSPTPEAPSPTPSPSVTPAPSPSPQPSSTPTPTGTPLPLPTPTPSQTAGPTPTPTPSVTPSPSPSSEPSPVPSPSVTPEVSPSPTLTPTPEPSPRPSSNPQPVPSEPNPIPSPTPQPEPTTTPSLPQPSVTPSPAVEPTPPPAIEPSPEPNPIPEPEPAVEPTPIPVEEPPAVEPPPVEEPTPQPIEEPIAIEEPAPLPVEEPPAIEPEPTPEPPINEPSSDTTPVEPPVEEVAPPVEAELPPAEVLSDVLADGKITEADTQAVIDSLNSDGKITQSEVNNLSESLSADGKFTQAEKELVAEVLIEAANGQAVTAEAIKEAGLDYSDLPDTQPVEVRTDENGNEVIITAVVADALELLASPAEMLSAIFQSPAQLIFALGNLGADMSPAEREEATKTVVAATIVGNIAATTVAASGAVGAVGYRRKP